MFVDPFARRNFSAFFPFLTHPGQHKTHLSFTVVDFSKSSGVNVFTFSLNFASHLFGSVMQRDKA